MTCTNVRNATDKPRAGPPAVSVGLARHRISPSKWSGLRKSRVLVWAQPQWSAFTVTIALPTESNRLAGLDNSGYWWGRSRREIHFWMLLFSIFQKISHRLTPCCHCQKIWWFTLLFFQVQLSSMHFKFGGDFGPNESNRKKKLNGGTAMAKPNFFGTSAGNTLPTGQMWIFTRR